MRDQHGVESIVQRLYERIGRDPSELFQIRPIDGGWDNALSYEITRSDMKRARIYRHDLDDQNEQEIASCLRRFV